MIKDIYLAAGCFWGAEKYLKQIHGVVSTEVGYANGNIFHPTYREVSTDVTGYAETVHVRYDSEQIGLERILQIYFRAIDPIWYTDSRDLPAIQSIYDRVRGELKQPLAVEVRPLKNFYRAEEEHQNYLEKHPGAYCHIPDSLMEFARTASEASTD